MTLICLLLGDSPCRESRREARALSSPHVVSADLAKIVAQYHKWKYYFTGGRNTPHVPMAMSTNFEAQCLEERSSPPDIDASVSNMRDSFMCLVTSTGRLGSLVLHIRHVASEERCTGPNVTCTHFGSSQVIRGVSAQCSSRS
jgi:hypothetical protein